MNNLGSVQLLKGLWRLYFSTRSSAPLSRWVSNWSSRRDKFNGTICNQIYWKIRIFNFLLKVVNCVQKSQFLHNFPSYLSAKKIVKIFFVILHLLLAEVNHSLKITPPYYTCIMQYAHLNEPQLFSQYCPWFLPFI